MTADVELLPLPEGEAIGWTQAWSYDQMRGYSRANVAHHTAPLQAEIEALRVRADAMAGEAIKHEARAERLAEAGRRVTAAFRALGDSSCITAAAIKRRECEAAMLAFDALLRDQEGPSREAGSA